MEELKNKIKEYESYISNFCQRHHLSEEDIKKMASCISERDHLIYQSKNEKWIKLAGPYLGIDEFTENYLDDRFKVVIHFTQNREEWRLTEIEKGFGVDIDSLYRSSYYDEDDKELDKLTDEFSSYDKEFILWALNKRMNKKVIYKKVNLDCSYDSYECYFLVKDKTMSDQEIDEAIDRMVLFIGDRVNHNFKQFQPEGDEIIGNDGCIYTIMAHELPSGDINNIKEVEEKLASFSETNRKIVIEWN